MRTTTRRHLHHRPLPPFAGRSTVTIFGSFLADWNTTHIYNPHWPPHARFHNGQTMSVGVLLGLAALFFTWRRRGDARTNLLAAGLFAAFYWVSQGMAFLFPGVAWTDPDLLKTRSNAAPGDRPARNPGLGSTRYPWRGDGLGMARHGASARLATTTLTPDFESETASIAGVRIRAIYWVVTQTACRYCCGTDF